MAPAACRLLPVAYCLLPVAYLRSILCPFPWLRLPAAVDFSLATFYVRAEAAEDLAPTNTYRRFGTLEGFQCGQASVGSDWLCSHMLPILTTAAIPSNHLLLHPLRLSRLDRGLKLASMLATELSHPTDSDYRPSTTGLTHAYR